MTLTQTETQVYVQAARPAQAGAAAGKKSCKCISFGFTACTLHNANRIVLMGYQTLIEHKTLASLGTSVEDRFRFDIALLPAEGIPRPSFIAERVSLKVRKWWNWLPAFIGTLPVT